MSGQIVKNLLKVVLARAVGIVVGLRSTGNDFSGFYFHIHSPLPFLFFSPLFSFFMGSNKNLFWQKLMGEPKNQGTAPLVILGPTDGSFGFLRLGGTIESKFIQQK